MLESGGGFFQLWRLRCQFSNGTRMKRICALTLLGLSLVLPGAHAAEDKAAGNPGTCTKQAGNRKGDDRKAFIKECLAAKTPAAAQPGGTPHQSKLKACNAKAKGMLGAERKKFMMECLKA
jgi:hypothetical protein